MVKDECLSKTRRSFVVADAKSLKSGKGLDWIEEEEREAVGGRMANVFRPMFYGNIQRK
jgi:hypothetical protein